MAPLRVATLTVNRELPEYRVTTLDLLLAAKDLNLFFALQLTHIKLGNFSGDVVLPSKLYQSKGEVQILV